MVSFIVSKVLGDYILGEWAIADDQHSAYGFYCGYFFLFSILVSVFVAARVASLQYFAWYGSKRLHEEMINRVLNAPVNLYFDTTPTGQILNRFSNDLQVFDNMLIYMIGSTLTSAYTLLSIMIIAVIIVPWVGFVFPVMAYLAWINYTSAIAGTKELSRIESVAKSPLVSMIGETISGSSTIRAFGKKEQFVEAFH